METQRRLAFRPHPNHERELVLQNQYIRLWYYPNAKIVHHHMVQSLPSDVFRELLTKGAELLERFNASKWLSDDRGNMVLRPQDEEWADTIWLPRALQGGFKYWAIVLPETAVGKLNMRRLAAQHEQRGVITHIVTKPLEAFEWLEAQ